MKRLLLFFLASVALLRAQTQTRTSPDCILNFTMTGNGASSNLNNVPQIASGQSTGGCVYWNVEADAFNSGAATLTFQSAPSSTVAGTAPGTFGTFTALSGTTSLGSNPTSSYPSSYLTTGYAPWLRINITSYSTGTIRGSIQGWRRPSSSSTGGGGGTPGGNPGDIQFNNSGSFGGEALVPVAHGGTGTATPSLVAGTGCTITGTWPNQTVACSGGGGGGFNPTTQTDVTASRSVGTIFQNTTAFPIWVSIVGNVTSGDSAQALTGSASPPTVIVDDSFASNVFGVFNLSFLVLPSYFYEVTSGTPGTLFLWIEWTGSQSNVSVANDCLTIGSNCYFGSRLTQATLPSAVSFSWQNQGTATVVTNANGTMTMSVPAAVADSIHIRYVAIPVAPYTVTGCMAGVFAQANSAGVGLALSNGTGIITLAVGFDDTVNATGTIQSLKFTNATTFNSVYSNMPWGNSTQGIACLRFVDDGAGNRISYYSADGQNFFQFLSVASTDFITPTRIGWFYNSTNNVAGTNTLVSWTSTTP